MERLPPEITTNILSRLPIKSSVQCRCVCKPWCEILTDSKYPLIHFSQISTINPDFLVYPLSREILYLDDSKEEFGRNLIKPLKVFSENFMHNSFYKDSIVLGACNGLICVANFNFEETPSSPIWIFNPITETSCKLPDYKDPEFEIPTELNHKRFMYGFGFDDSNQEFKFMLVTFFGHNLNETQICTLGGSTWRRKTGCAPDVLNLARRQHSTAFVNQCLHWVADLCLTIPIIVSFNLGVEEFDFVPIPPSHGRLTIGVLEGHLSAVDYTHVSHIHIWVMQKYKVKESWVKQFSIEHSLICQYCNRFLCYFETLKFRKNGELLLQCNGRDFLSYNIRSQKIMIYKIEQEKVRLPMFKAQPFVGSFMKLSSDCRRDPQRDLRKRRKRKREEQL